MSVTTDNVFVTADSIFVTADGGYLGQVNVPLWSADGNYARTADGFPGWSADGYEPTPFFWAVVNLAAAGLNVGQLTYQYSQTVPLGWVITGYYAIIHSTPPPAGSYVPLVISLGPAPPVTLITVPNVVGKYYPEAQQAILAAGLCIATPKFIVSNTVNPGYVTAQSLTAGSQQAPNTLVTITVAGFQVVMQPGVIVPVP